MKSILDRSFKYVPAAETDLRKTFSRIARERKKESERPSASILTPAKWVAKRGGA